MIRPNLKNANKNNKHTHQKNKKNVSKLILNKEKAPTCSVKLFECEKNTSFLAICACFQSSKLLYFTHKKSKNKTTLSDGQNKYT